REEETIAQRRLLLEIVAERLVGRRQRRAGRRDGGLRHRLAAWRKLRTGRVRRLAFLVRVVGAERRLEVEVRLRLPRGVARELHREVAIDAVAIDHVTLPPIVVVGALA